MEVHLEHLASILRILPPGGQFGDPYLWCCTVRWLSPTEVELCGVDKPLTRPMRRAIADYLTQHTTVQAVRFVRRKGPRSIEHQVQRKTAGAADV